MLQGQTCVVFDLDGTLADTSDDLLASANACFRAMGAGDLLTRADALTAFHGGRAMLRLGFQRLGRGDEAEVDQWYPRLLEAYAGAIAVHTQMYPGAVEAVETLRRQGHAVAICTNKPEGLAETLMKTLGVRDLFGALVGADTLPVRKPDPAPYRLADPRQGPAAAWVEHRCTVSIGVALLGKGAGTVDAALSVADRAMYEAKRAGPNSICQVESAASGDA